MPNVLKSIKLFGWAETSAPSAVKIDSVSSSTKPTLDTINNVLELSGLAIDFEKNHTIEILL